MDPLYDDAIAEALDALPSRICEAMKDVVIIVEERPSRRPDAYPIRHGQVLLGLYEGVPLTAWGREWNGKPPDKITLFREPIEKVAGSPENVPRLIRETLWHEIAHYFGFGHEKIHAMEKRWRTRRSTGNT